MRPDPFVSGLVLAAGGSSRLGRPKQLLPYRGATLLDAVLDTARSCEFDQLVVTLGGSVLERRARDVVDVPVAGPAPRDVDTWKDYAAAVAAAGQ